MKTKEFIKRAEALGYEAVESEYASTIVVYKGSNMVVTVSTGTLYSLDTNYECVLPKALYELATEYAGTPVEERECELLYRIKVNDMFLANWGVDGILPTFIIDNQPGVETFAMTFKGKEKAEAVARLVGGKAEVAE